MRRAVILAVLVSACSTQTGADDSYVLSEWAIAGSDSIDAADTVSLTVDNGGEFRHTLLVTTETGEVVGATGVVDPGAVTTLELELVPGTYNFSCRIVTQDDEGNLSDHYQRGMHRTVIVGG